MADPVYTRQGDITIITIESEGVDASTEIGPLLVPMLGQITMFKQELRSGTATTTAPEMGITPGWTTADAMTEVFARAASGSHNDAAVIRFEAPDGELYLRPVPDAGADNAISTKIFVKGGH